MTLTHIRQRVRAWFHNHIVAEAPAREAIDREVSVRIADIGRRRREAESRRETLTIFAHSDEAAIQRLWSLSRDAEASKVYQTPTDLRSLVRAGEWLLCASPHVLGSELRMLLTDQVIAWRVALRVTAREQRD